jgi:hypothetical protein
MQKKHNRNQLIDWLKTKVHPQAPTKTDGELMRKILIERENKSKKNGRHTSNTYKK